VSDVKDQAAPAAPVELSSRLMIDDLIADSVHVLDDDELERWPDFFTDDGIYKITTRENYVNDWPLGIMYCDSQGMMRDRILALRTANVFEPHTYCHLLGRSRVTQAGQSFKARTNFEVIRTMQNGSDFRFATGKYLDDIVLQNGVMKLKSRIVVLESRRVDILLVVPL